MNFFNHLFNFLKPYLNLSLRVVLFIGLAIHTGCDNAQSGKNRLADARSPYLLEHADNPVNWYEWGEEALKKAKDENKPLIISIGYASCHWCHVMEEESFMDTAVARIMNENFVAIKVDREERPDIDQIYIQAAQLISGRAGWPLNAFALPDGKPFYAATYFTKPDWISVLREIRDLYKNERPNLVNQAADITRGIQTYEVIQTPPDSTALMLEKNYTEAFKKLSAGLDFRNGGFYGAPKFPMPSNWESMLQYYFLTKNEDALRIVTTTLDRMGQGGIYDQLGGGFARYATDTSWNVPHFEKMLYDNAQLVSLYAHAYQLTKDPFYADIIHGTLSYIESNMTTAEGGFYSSLNADSDGEEGKFYCWTKKEILDLLETRDGELISAYYNVSASGNWENGKNILYTTVSDSLFSLKHGLQKNQWLDIKLRAQSTLRSYRDKRIHPSTDDKILTSWNALMMKAFVDAYHATGEPRYLEVALKNASFIEQYMVHEQERLWRVHKDGRSGVDAFLDDYAQLAKAYIHLYEATFDLHWLERSKVTAEYAIKHFQDQTSGLFFYASDQSQDLAVRKMELSDNVIPSSNAVMADVLLRLGTCFQDDRYLKMSRSMVTQVMNELSNSPPFYAHWTSVMGWWVYEPYEVAIVGTGALEKSKIFRQHYIPLAMFIGGSDENLPLLQHKSVSGKTMIYVCQNRTCKLPVENVNDALKQIK